MSQYLNPFPQHFNVDGNPNAFYVVYFGEPNQDPKANPKVPYSDRALSVPISATQTLSNEGAYQQDIYLDGAYSIRVETPLGSLWRETPHFEGLLFSNVVDNFTVPSMIADTSLQVGDFVSTVGYNSAGDGGDNVYEIVAAATGTDDGGSYIGLASGLQAKGLFTDGIHSAKQWGATGDGVTDDTAALQAAFDSGFSVTITEGIYEHTGLNFPSSSKEIIGHGSPILNLISGSNSDSLLISGSSVKVSGLNLDGRGSLQSAGQGISVASGVSNATIENNFIVNSYEHGIQASNVDGMRAYNNVVVNSYTGSGINCSSAGISTDVIVTGNEVRNSQEANISAIGPIRDWVVSDNVCEVTNWNGVGDVADNITGYNDQNDRIVIDGNICVNSENNGMHIGGDNLTISNNIVESPRFNGIFIAKDPNVDPTEINGYAVSGNTILCDTSEPSSSDGIRAYNCRDGSISGNSVLDGLNGITVGRIGSSTIGNNNTSITGNSLRRCRANGISIDNDAEVLSITGNTVESDGVIAGTSGINCDVITSATITGNSIKEFDTAITDSGDDTCVISANTAIGTVSTIPYVSFGLSKQRDNLPSIARTVASSATINTGNDMNAAILLTGTTAISSMDTALVGRIVTLYAQSNTRTLNHNAGGFIALQLAGAVNYSLTPNNWITFMYNGLGWLELGRS